MQPGEYVVAHHAPVNYRGQSTIAVTLPNADPPQKLSFKNLQGRWLVWCPDGSPQHSIQMAVQLEGAAAPASGALDPPAAGDQKPIVSRPSSAPFIIDVDSTEWVDYYFQWNGAAASTLTLSRVYTLAGR